MDASNTETDDDSGWNCSVHPSVFFLLGTLLLTICSTGMLCASIMTDHWEEVTWSQERVENFTNVSLKLQWLLDGKVGKITDLNEQKSLAFLVPMHGGIWTLCLSLSEEEIYLLGGVQFPRIPLCVNYLAGNDRIRINFDRRNDWQHSKYLEDVEHHRQFRMQNLSISCALVCLIILGSAALVGAFGVCQHQISAVLVTGVMYLLAASFAIFTLMIIHLKRLHTKPKMDEVDLIGGVDGVISFPGIQYPREILSARIFTTSWSLDLGWGGVTLCVMTSILWILLSKIMRFNPISSMIN